MAAKRKAAVNSKEAQVEKLQAEIVAEHRQKEADKIEALQCGSCKVNLGLKSKDYMKEGTTRKIVECPKCEILNDVTVGFPGSPDETFVITEVVAGGYKWEQSNMNPGELTDKQIIAWSEAEVAKSEKGASNLPRNTQLLLRLIKAKGV
jgi:hypothetical protein